MPGTWPGGKDAFVLGDSQTATTFFSAQSLLKKGPKEQFDQTVCVDKVKMTTLLNRSTTSLLTKPPRTGQFGVLHRLITSSA